MMGDQSEFSGLLGAGMPTTPEEMQRMLAMAEANTQFSAGQAAPYAKNLYGQVPAGGFSPRDLFNLTAGSLRAPYLIGASLLGRGMPVAALQGRPSMWDFLKGL
jgi:hypothetical protein